VRRLTAIENAAFRTCAGSPRVNFDFASA
jgi:hypothetical protein